MRLSVAINGSFNKPVLLYKYIYAGCCCCCVYKRETGTIGCIYLKKKKKSVMRSERIISLKERETKVVCSLFFFFFFRSCASTKCVSLMLGAPLEKRVEQIVSSSFHVGAIEANAHSQIFELGSSRNS